MKPVYWIIAIVVGAGGMAGWQFMQQRQAAGASAGAGASGAMAPDPAPAPRPAASSLAAHPVTTAAAQAEPPSGDQVAQWIKDVDSTDAARRTVAIRALAHAPRAQALPVLERLVMNADPVDRPLALKSLRDLAVEQGDADNAARQAIRQVIYHGDDEQLAASAQDALDSVEAAQPR